MQEERNPRLERIKDLLVCPKCKSGLEWQPEGASCRDCGRIYPVRGGRIFFVGQPERADELDSVKGRLKKAMGRFYYSIGVNVFAPYYPFNLRRWVDRYSDPEKIVVDAGCGNRRVDENIIGLDIMDYDAVDVVCDLTALPFSDGCIDVLFSHSVLEHLPKPFEVVKEFERCTAPEGINLHLVPFLYPFHSSPDDYYRFTYRGMESLFEKCDVIECFTPSGPVTLLLAMAVEFLSTIFSLGNEKLKAYLYLFFCGVLFPVKYLDVFFIKHRSFWPLAPLFFMVFKKKNPSHNVNPEHESAFHELN